VVLHLFRIPAGSNAEEEPSIREQIEARDRLGQRDRVVLDDETDARPDLQVLGDGRGRGEPDERVERVRVLLGQGATAPERRAPARGMCVCSVTNSDSNPRSSAARASSSIRIE
jgi:hypothetical protein